MLRSLVGSEMCIRDSFITKVRSKGRLFIHADINLDDDWIFSAYMDFKNPKYAFWYKGNKYPIEERKLIQMIEKFKLYFDTVSYTHLTLPTNREV